jgi:hypothetical protein
VQPDDAEGAPGLNQVDSLLDVKSAVAQSRCVIRQLTDGFFVVQATGRGVEEHLHATDYDTGGMLEVASCEAGVSGDAGQHPGSDFLRVMESPGEFPFRRVDKLEVGRTLA